ncbi:MAG: hypothetical protein ACRCT1_07150 [Microcoleaceae cyanobacterium]
MAYTPNSKQSPDNRISVEEFIQALNSYTGDNVWQEIIYRVDLTDDQIDREKTEDDDN